eukprot:scaffold955_cov79-Skeletonema_dohrnii-CCMP3373.AAC.7
MARTWPFSELKGLGFVVDNIMKRVCRWSYKSSWLCSYISIVLLESESSQFVQIGWRLGSQNSCREREYL